jgi:hypothetical protein
MTTNELAENPFVSEFVDMDLSPLYDLKFNIVDHYTSEDGKDMFSVQSYIPIVIGPCGFEELLGYFQDRVMTDEESMRITVFVASSDTTKTRYLSLNTLEYIRDKADNLLTEYMLLGHQDIEYDCKAEIEERELNFKFTEQDTDS